MKIRQRGLSRVQIAIGLVLGTVGGVYIWKPIFDKFLRDEQEKRVSQEAEKFPDK